MTGVVAIVQARMGSTRLPGKVLMDLAGQTVLSHVLERCAAIKGVDQVCCAIPDKPEDDPVAMEARLFGAAVFRGSERDVLDRYFQAAQRLDSQVVMRITSDCPVVDPHLASDVLRLVTEGGADYACNNMPPSWPHGLDCEVFRFCWLAQAAKEARLPSEREHVTPWLRKNASLRRENFAGPGNGVEAHRWTLDTPADLAFLRALFSRLPRRDYDWRRALAVVEGDPSLPLINGGQDRDAGYRKSLVEDAGLSELGHHETETHSGSDSA